MKNLFLLVLFILTTNSVYSQTVYITKTGEKYHSEGCVHLRRSSISINLTEAIEKGYDACKVCKPSTSQNRGTTLKKTSSTDNSNKRTTETQSKSSSIQCSGTTKKGARCKRMTTNTSGRCYQH